MYLISVLVFFTILHVTFADPQASDKQTFDSPSTFLLLPMTYKFDYKKEVTNPKPEERAKCFPVNQTRFAFRHRRFAVCSYAAMSTAVLFCLEESK